MFTLFIRAILIYLLVLTVFRLMGKRQVGQLQPFELVLTLIIADLATIPMAESNIPIFHGLIPLLTLVALHFFLTLITRKCDFLGRVISGKPVIVVNPEGIDYQALKNLNISLDDLFESIRACNHFSLDEIQYVIVETNGKVSVLPKHDFAPVTNAGLAIKGEPPAIPITIVNEGTWMPNNAKIAEVDNSFLDWVLKKTKVKLKDILILTLDANGKVYFQSKTGKSQIFHFQPKKEAGK